MRTRGLTLGKFAPFHKGHQLVLDTALSEVDDLTVLIYEAPETTIPLAVRAGWIGTLYPDVEVIEAWGGPSETGYDPAVMRAHESYIIDTLGVRDITHFYSSEPYGEHMSRALGAIDRRVDDSRERVPISGTQLRNDPYLYREYVHPLVYRDLITRVVFLGAPCTGKTALAAELARVFQTQWMPEYGREYWELHQVNRRLTPDQLVEIVVEHRRQEDCLAAGANRYLFVDTNAITTLTFCRYYYRQVPEALSEAARLAATSYDLTFVCEPDFPYVETWDRSGEVNRKEFHTQVLSDLRERRVPFFRLTGSLQQRVEQVQRVLSKHSKFMNLLELTEACS
jgi:HTH-type transcriptional regulator, transcriptional repressor of NAD biosynthesis genes